MLGWLLLWRKHVDSASPQVVLASVLGSAPSPTYVLESESVPEQIGGEVDGTP